MLRRLLIPVSAALLAAACSQPPPPPIGASSQSYIVFFDFDSSRLTAQGLDTVRQAAGAYKGSGSASGMTATGHADRAGSDAYNMGLSIRRASNVKAALVNEAVPAAAIAVVGRGESQPLVQTADGVQEPQNRRVEITMGMANPNDLAYCKAMSRLYRQYLGNRQSTSDAGEAMAQCDAGNPGPAIPVLEKLLTDAKINLPPRG